MANKKNLSIGAIIVVLIAAFFGIDLQQFQSETSSAPTTANYSHLRKMQPTDGLSASCSSLRWTKKAEQRKRPPLPYWYKLPTFATL